MTQDDKNRQEQQDVMEEMEQEIEEIENEEGGIDEEELEAAQGKTDPEEEKCKEILARTVADFDNFKKRVERDKQDMIFFLKQDIFKKILPRVDDIERIIKNTPVELQEGVVFEGIVALQKKLEQDLQKLGVQAFVSLGEEVNPDKHEVMTTIPGKTEGVICDEFEKGYELEGRVLRHAKVVVGAGE